MNLHEENLNNIFNDILCRIHTSELCADVCCDLFCCTSSCTRAHCQIRRIPSGRTVRLLSAVSVLTQRFTALLVLSSRPPDALSSSRTHIPRSASWKNSHHCALSKVHVCIHQNILANSCRATGLQSPQSYTQPLRHIRDSGVLNVHVVTVQISHKQILLSLQEGCTIFRRRTQRRWQTLSKHPKYSPTPGTPQCIRDVSIPLL